MKWAWVVAPFLVGSLTLSAYAAPEPLMLTRQGDAAWNKQQQGAAVRFYQQALQRFVHHPLRPYWVSQLAQAGMPHGLEENDALLPHYYWWRAMAQPEKVCSTAFTDYARTAKLSAVPPLIADSKQIQVRLHCLENRPESERLAVAQILDQHRYLWLLPRLLKHVTSPEGLWLQGKSHMSARAYKEALSSFQVLMRHARASEEQKKQAMIEAGLAERRLKNPRAAESFWNRIASQDEQFYPEVLWQRAMMAASADKRSVADQHLTTLLSRFPKHERGPEAFEALLRSALQSQNWPQVKQLSERILQTTSQHEYVSMARYWLGRSLMRLGQKEVGQSHLRTQAQKGPLNHYYTHLAQCELDGRDCFQLRRLPLKAREPQLAFLHKLPILEEIVAAREGRIIEVIAPFVSLEPLERDLLRAWALRENGHYFRSIRTIWRMPTRDAQILRLMYPLHYDGLQKENAQRFQLPQALIAGLTWQESMYMADIQSPAGATGLMQLMPATAKDIAAKAGVTDFRLEQLKEPKVNIRLGSYYLYAQLQRWKGNLMPTIAAYNAGPGAASKWLKSFGHLEKPLFVEQIPYDETRRYVKQVLTHLSVYEQMYTP